MNIFDLLKNLYCNRKTDWIKGIDDNEIEPYKIQRFLAMNDALRVQVRWLDGYAISLPPKMYLSLAWSVIPKVSKAPFIKYINKEKYQQDEFYFIFPKIRKHFNLSDNDFNSMKERLRSEIKKDMVNWFSFYGVEKRFWNQFHVKFDLIKQFNKVEKAPGPDLSKWGL